MIIDVLGFPKHEELEMFSDAQDQELLMSIEKKPPMDFNKLFEGKNPLGVDLVRKMLTFDPNKRISVE